MRNLTHQQMGEALIWVETLEAYAQALREQVKAALQAGETVPGWGLGKTKPHRKWVGETLPVVQSLKALGFDPFTLTVTALISPAKAEALAKKQKLLKGEFDRDEFDKLILAPVGEDVLKRVFNPEGD